MRGESEREKMSREGFENKVDAAMQSTKRKGAWRWLIPGVLVVAVAGLGYGGWWWFSTRPKPADPADLKPLHAAIDAEPDLSARTQEGPDGGVLITGKLAGRQFYIAVPKHWNRSAIVFAGGYSMPGSNTDVQWRQVSPGSKHPLRPFYALGFAIAQSSFDKSGLDVDSAVRNTLRLNKFVHRLGASPVYLIGASMGGSVAVNMIQDESRPFRGALAVCGAVGGWDDELKQLIDMRVIYDYFTRGTPYAMPGSTDLRRDMINPRPPRVLQFAEPLWAMMQVKRITRPIDALFRAAQKNPNGQEAAIVHRIAQTAGLHEDFASFAWPLFTVGLGMSDMVNTLGGSPYSNREKLYHAASLSAEENAAMNRDIGRIDSDPAAVAKAQRWQATGRFDIPLVTLHNAADAVVPYAQETILREAVEHTGNTANLYQITVPALFMPPQGRDLNGLTHCGFTPDQVLSAFKELERRSDPEITESDGNDAFKRIKQ